MNAGPSLNISTGERNSTNDNNSSHERTNISSSSSSSGISSNFSQEDLQALPTQSYFDSSWPMKRHTSAPTNDNNSRSRRSTSPPSSPNGRESGQTKTNDDNTIIDGEPSANEEHSELGTGSAQGSIDGFPSSHPDQKDSHVSLLTACIASLKLIYVHS